MTGTPLILAVDAGGTTTDAWLAGADGTRHAAVRGPGFRPHDGPAAPALALLVTTLRRALGDATAAVLVACLAGVDLPEDEIRARTALVRAGLAGRVEVRNDTFAVLRAGTVRGWGVAIVCGTGTNCAAVGPDGRQVRFPALGELTGDRGGGGWLARQALAAAVRGEDGRGPRTALTAAVAGHYGLGGATAAGVALSRGTLPYGRLHELPPLLMRVAAAGDAVAAAIVERQAEEIAVLGVTALRRLGLLGTPAEVVLGGGVITAGAPLLDSVRRRYAAAAPYARLVVLDVPPVLGAALYGLDLLDAAPAAYDRLRAG